MYPLLRSYSFQAATFIALIVKIPVFTDLIFKWIGDLLVDNFIKLLYYMLVLLLFGWLDSDYLIETILAIGILF